jgi:hypothetical protein
MKILECKSRNIINTGFIDLDKIHIKTLTDNPKEGGKPSKVSNISKLL